MKLCAQVLVNSLEDKACPWKRVSRLTDLNSVDWAVKLPTQFKQMLLSNSFFLGFIVQSVACLTGDPRGHKFKFQLGQITFMEIDHETFLFLFCPFHRFKQGSYQLLLKVCAQVLVNHLRVLLRKSVCRLTDQCNMTLTVLTGL